MNAWWSYILGDEIVLAVREEARLGYSVRLDTGGIANRSFGQVGFGLSQLWPILVSGLVSRPCDLVIVETPEAHLHPGAQHRLGALFVALAERGRQVVVETHSEHVVNAACLAVQDRRIADPARLALSFFTQAQGCTRVERIGVDGTGRRLAAPPGFFDQAAEELLGLLKP
jgi:predicted ATPase